MKKIATLISIGTLFFNGCAGSSYSISTSGQENANVAFIKFSDTCLYQIDNVSKYAKSSRLEYNFVVRKTDVTIVSKSTCNMLSHLNKKMIDNNKYFLTSNTDDFLRDNRNCQLESSINGIKFLQCNGTYTIVSEETKYDGYDNKNIIYTSKECYEALKKTISSCQK